MLPGNFRADKYIFRISGSSRIKMITADIESFDLFWDIRLDLRQVAHHITPGHLGIDALLHYLAVLDFPEHAGDEAVLWREVFLKLPGVSSKMQIDLKT